MTRDAPPWFMGPIWAICLVGAAALCWRMATLERGYWVTAVEVIGADFGTFWSAARVVVAGEAASVFDVQSFDLAQKASLGAGRQFAFWSYPPPTLFLYLPFATLDYLPALLAWTAVGAALFAPVAVRMLGWRSLPLLLFCPAAALNMLAGQNGFVTATLLLGGLSMVERRPWLAGAVLGLLALKPQMALLLPVAVIAGRHWRVMSGAALSVAALLVLSVAAFGLEPWRTFVTQTLPFQSHALRFGQGWFQNSMPTAFMALRVTGAPWQAGAAAQTPFLLLGGVLVWRAWRRSADLEHKAVVLILASACASPQMFNYDLVAYSAALLMWVRRDPRPATCALALVGWGLPAFCIVLSGLHVPLSPLLLALIAGRAAASPAILSSRPQRSGEPGPQHTAPLAAVPDQRSAPSGMTG